MKNRTKQKYPFSKTAPFVFWIPLQNQPAYVKLNTYFLLV